MTATDDTRRLPTDVEAIVVGGGPAGSTVAAGLAAAGHRVLLLDKAAFPRHKPCSEYINAGGAAQLDGMGLTAELDALGAHRMTAMVVHAPGGGRFRADFGRVEPGRAALGLSRHKLDALLVERARAAGADVRERAHVREVSRDAAGRVTGVVATIGGQRETIRARVVIGADGHDSIVTRSLGLDGAPRWPRKTGLVAHYRNVRDLDRFGEMHVGRGVYAGLAPLEQGLTNVAVVASDATVAARTGSVDDFFRASLAALPGVMDHLDGAERVGGIRGVGGMARTARRTTGDGFLLAGDAASFLDPFTGDGIYEALRGGSLAVPVLSAALRESSPGPVSAASLRPYRAARRRSFTAKRDVCWIVQGFIHAPPLMDYVAARLNARDELGLTLSGVLGNIRPATAALSPVFLARLLRP